MTEPFGHGSQSARDCDQSRADLGLERIHLDLAAANGGRGGFKATLSPSPLPVTAPGVQNTVASRVHTAIQAAAVHGGVHLHTGGPKAVIPRQLPVLGRFWVDREDVLSWLTQLADRHGPVIAVISGISGVGKTAVSVRWVQDQRARFTDGELYADLSEVDGADVLASWLRALGQRRLPRTPAELEATWRSVTVDSALALLIDNAATGEQVRPLLPASRRSVTIVTSHAPLVELLSYGAQLHHLRPLTSSATAQLIRAVASEHNIDLSEEIAQEITGAAAGMPLRAVLAAGHVALSEIGFFEAAQRGIEIPDMSYDALPAPRAQVLYRRLGDHPSRLVTVEAAAAMLKTNLAEARQTLKTLRDSGLLSEHSGHYEVPQQLQRHARALAERQDGEVDRRAARARVIEHGYLPPLIEADYCLNPYPRRYNDAYADLQAGTRPPRFTSPEDALRWCMTHLGTLRGLVRQAHRDGNHAAACNLAEASWGPILKGRCNDYLVETHELAVGSGQQCGHPATSVLYSRLSWGYRNLGRIEAALDASVTARWLAAEAGDQWAEATAWSAEGRVHFANGDYKEALHRFQRSLTIVESLNDLRGMALRHRHIGECHVALCEPDEAIKYMKSAAELMQAIGDSDGYAGVLGKLVDARLTAGQNDIALREAREALKLMRSSGSDAYVADALARVGQACQALGHSTDARLAFTEAQRLYAAIGDHTNAARMANACRRP